MIPLWLSLTVLWCLLMVAIALMLRVQRKAVARQMLTLRDAAEDKLEGLRDDVTALQRQVALFKKHVDEFEEVQTALLDALKMSPVRREGQPPGIVVEYHG